MALYGGDGKDGFKSNNVSYLVCCSSLPVLCSHFGMTLFGLGSAPMCVFVAYYYYLDIESAK